MAYKGNYKTNEEKEEWMGVLKMTIMSSDSSGEDDGEDGGPPSSLVIC